MIHAWFATVGVWSIEHTVYRRLLLCLMHNAVRCFRMGIPCWLTPTTSPCGFVWNWIAQNLMLENPVFPTQVAINCWNCSMSPPFSIHKIHVSNSAHHMGLAINGATPFIAGCFISWKIPWKIDENCGSPMTNGNLETSISTQKSHLRISAPSCREPSNGFPGPTSPWTSHLDEEGTRIWWKKPVKRTSDVY